MVSVTIQEPLMLATFTTPMTGMNGDILAKSKSKSKKDKSKQQNNVASTHTGTELANEALDVCLFRTAWAPTALKTIAEEHPVIDEEQSVADSESEMDAPSEEQMATVQLAVQGEGVQMYQAFEQQRCVKSWLSAPNVRFCTAPLYMTREHQNALVYVGVQCTAETPVEQYGRVIWCWQDDEVSDFSGRHQATIDYPICALVQLPIAHHSIMVVHTDGSISIVDEALNKLAQSQTHGKSRRVLAYAVQPIETSFLPKSKIREIEQAAHTLLVCIAITSTKPSNECELRWLTVNTQNWSINELDSLTLKTDAKSTLTDCALDLASGSVSIIDQHGKGTCNTISFGSTGFSVRRSISVSPTDDVVFGHAPAITFVDGGYLACVATHTAKTADRVEHRLTIWDTHYGTLQAQKKLSSDALPTSNTKATSIRYQVQMSPWSQIVVAVTTSSTGRIASGATQRTVVFGSLIECRAISLLGAIGQGCVLNGVTKDSNVFAKESGVASVTNLPKGDLTRLDAWSAAHSVAQTEEKEFLQKILAPDITAETFTWIYMSRFGDETYRAKAKLYMKQLNAKTSKKSKSEKKKVPQLPPPDTLKSKDEVQSQLDEAEKELASLEKQLEDMGEERNENRDTKRRRQALQQKIRRQQKKVQKLKSTLTRAPTEVDAKVSVVKPTVEPTVEPTVKPAVKPVKPTVELGQCALDKSTVIHRPSQPLAAILLAHCFRQKEDGKPDMTFWPQEVVRAMLQLGFVSACYVRGPDRQDGRRGTSRLLRSLADREAWDLVILALKRVPDLAERDVIAVLRRVCDRHLAGQTDAPAPSTMLASCMSAPVNRMLLVRALSRMPSAHIVLLLETIIGWVRAWSDVSLKQADPPRKAKHSNAWLRHAKLPPFSRPLDLQTPAYSTVLDSASHLLDAQLTLLALTPEVYPLLRELNRFVKAEIAAVNAWERLRGALAPYWLNKLARERRIMPQQEGSSGPSTRVLGEEAAVVATRTPRSREADQARQSKKPSYAERVAQSESAGAYSIEVLQF